MANAILGLLASRATFTITLASLASSSVGVGRQSTIISNSGKHLAALIQLGIKSNGTAPTAGAYYEVYLLRGDGTARTDGAGASDAALTRVNAQLLGVIKVTATANTVFYQEFNTWPLGPLGLEWGILVVNASGQALHATEGDHVKGYTYWDPEIQ